MKSYEFSLCLLLLCLIVLQLIVIYRQAIYCILFAFVVYVFRKRLRGLRFFVALMVLLVSGVRTYYTMCAKDLFDKAIAERNLPEEPEYFSGVVVDDLFGRKQGIATYVLHGQFEFYQKSVGIALRVPDAPWRAESSFQVGDKVRCFLPLFQNSANDLQMTLRYLWSGVLAVTTIKADRVLEYYCQKVSAGTAYAGTSKVRTGEQILSELLDDPAASRIGAGILLATTMGRGEYVEIWVQDLFKETGLYHLLVVSGYHLAVVVSVTVFFVHLLTRQFPRVLGTVTQKECVAFGIWVGMLWFIVIGQLKPPLIRASLMTLCFTLATIANRRSSTRRSLLYSLIVIHMVMPLAICNPGVQFSYSALCGVFFGLFVARRLSEYRLKKKSTQLPFRDSRVRAQAGYLLSLCMTSCSTYLFILPLQLFWFSAWTPYAVIFNILFIPLFSFFVVGSGIVLIFLRMLEVPGSAHLLVYHTVLIEKIVDVISGFYDFITFSH